MQSGRVVRRTLLVPIALLGGACASKGDVQQMEANMLAEVRAIKASQDSLNLELRGVVVDSLETQEMRQLQGRSEQQRQLAAIQQSLAQILDLSLSAVKSLLFRARTQLKENLQTYLDADEVKSGE